MKRVILTISVMLLLFLTFSTVQATDDNQTTIASDNITVEKTFSSIQKTIDNAAQSDTILLEGTYTGDGKAITINKSITIKGTNEGAKLNANRKSRIFNIYADNVTLENLVLINGYDYDGGAGIYNTADNLKINKCNFTNNNVDMYGAGILSTGDNVRITNCKFTRNTAIYTGGAFQLDGNNNYADNCIFERNTGGHVGGAVAWVGDNGVLKNSVFSDSGHDIPSQHGGAVVWIGANGTLTKSSFYNNKAKKSGAAVYWRGENGHINYCIFSQNEGNTDLAYWGNPEYASNNYWGMNINTADEFTNQKLMYFNGTAQAPKNWVNLESSKYVVKFTLNTGGELQDYLPDYTLSQQATIHENYFIIQKATIMTLSNVKIYAGNAQEYQIILKDENNVRLKSMHIQIILNNKVYNLQTDKNGIAKLKINIKKSGKYNLKVTFKGDRFHKASSKNTKITVNKQKPKISIKTSKKTIKVTLKNQFKKGISKQKIKITVNKKTYIKKTNKKGMVSFKLKLKNKKKFKAIINYKGDKTYKSVSKKVIIKS